MTKTTDSFIKTNQEYVKGSSSATGMDKTAYREQPERLASGGAGHQRPTYVDWTDQELLSHARRLHLIDAQEDPGRERLIQLLEAARHPRG